MAHNQSRAERTESSQYRKSGRSNYHRNFSGGGTKGTSGTGGAATGPPPPSTTNNTSSFNNSNSQPSLSSNRSFKKHNNVQGGISRASAAPSSQAVNSDCSTHSAPRAVQNGAHAQQPFHVYWRAVQNGAHAQQPFHGASDAPPTTATVKPTDVASPKATRAPRAPSPKVPSVTSDSKHPPVPVTPAKAPADASWSFPLQFGSMSPGLMNGMQIPTRTSSAPPNLDEQKRDQARHDSLRAPPAMPIPSIPKQQLPKEVSKKKKKKLREEAGRVDQSNAAESHPIPKPKRDAQVAAVPATSQTQKPSVHSIPGLPMQMPFHQPQVPVQFGGPNPQIQSQAMSSASLPMPMPMPMPLQIGSPAVQQPVFFSGLQPHPMQSQGIPHQGQTLTFTSHMGLQIPQQLGNIGINIAPQYPQQQAGKFGGPRKAVKIIHPETQEELRLDGSPAPRSHTNVAPQSQPISSFPPAHPANYYPNSYNANSLVFPPPSSIPLNTSHPSSQPPRYYNQVTVKPAASSHGEKDPTSLVTAVTEKEPIPVIVPISEENLKHKDDGTEDNNAGSVSSSASGIKEKSLPEPSVAKGTVPRGKKKRKEFLKKLHSSGPTSDLYLAYKGPEEKKETVISAGITESTSSSNLEPMSLDVSQKDVPKEKAGQGKVESDDWEDVVDISPPKQETSENWKQVDESGEDGNGVLTKKYSRDILLKLAEQCTDIPEGFEIAPDFVKALTASNRVSRESYPSSGRIVDRPNVAERLDRRGSGLGEEDKWNKLPAPLMSGRDMRMDIYSPNMDMFRPDQVGNHGVLRNSRMQTPVQFPGGILPGQMRSLVPQIGVPRNSSDSDRWQRGIAFQTGLMPSPQTPLQIMHKANRKYEIGKVTDEEEAKQRQLKAILNKLTPQNFEKLFEQVKQVNIDNVVTLTGVISQIFDKALMEPTFCEMYANFFFHLAAELPDLSVDNEKITLRRLLLNKFQEEFERGEREQEEANKADEEGEAKLSAEEREEKRLRARRRMLGNIRLIGELYKKRMLTERIMHDCIKKLQGQHHNPDEEDIEALCKLMSTIGEIIDHPKAKERMDLYFDMMEKLSNNMKLSSRVRFRLKDAIDLRKNRWQQRRKVEGPKKIEEVHLHAGPKKFVIEKFLKFNMVDSKPVIKQVEKLQRIIHELHVEDCTISEQFQVGSIIEKLPPSWNDFKIYLKHKRREMTMEDLILRLRVEEDHRKGDRIEGEKANVIEGMTISKPKF